MKYLILLLYGTIFFTCNIEAKDYNNNKETMTFINKMVEEYNFKRAYLKQLFSNVRMQKTPLKIVSPEPNTQPSEVLKEKYPPYGAWDRYVKHKVTPERIKQGVSFLKKYRSTFKKVEDEYGVPSEYIAAIIGIETVYGGNVGKYPVFDTLTTLAFEKNRRSGYFKKELEQFILLSYRQKFNPKMVVGSYTGAIGLGQFMPSNYEAYGIDFNGDGKISLQHPQDAIASIANYLKQNGWRSGEHVATRVIYEGSRFEKLATGYDKTYERKDLEGIRPMSGRWDYFDKVRLIKLNRKSHDELWYGAKNFYVITRYNHSAYYAMSVHQLASKIKKQSKG
jgi:membrane-bound lytic murein transglycosylase B